MVNRCVVDGCTSGSASNRHKHSKLGTRNTSLFTVPQHPDQLELWESALNQKLVPKKNYVCELHFNEEDIIKSDKIKMANGTEELMRKRYALKQGAIPALNPTNLNGSRSTKYVDTSIIPCTEKCASEPRNIVLINENCLQQHDGLLIGGDFNSNRELLEDFNSIIKSEETDHENEEMVREIQSLNSNCELLEDFNSIIKSEETDHDNEEMVHESPISEVSNEEFSLSTIFNELKFNALPENWSWTTDYFDSKTLVLCYIDKISMKLKFRVKINQNFNVWLANITTEKLIDINKSFYNISDFWNFLKELENYTLCDGTGFDQEKCSLDCTGVPLSYEKYKKQMIGFRCVACRKLRSKLRNQSNSDYKERYDNLKYQESLKNKQIERLKRRNKLLKEIICKRKVNCLVPRKQ